MRLSVRYHGADPAVVATFVMMSSPSRSFVLTRRGSIFHFGRRIRCRSLTERRPVPPAVLRCYVKGADAEKVGSTAALATFLQSASVPASWNRSRFLNMLAVRLKPARLVRRRFRFALVALRQAPGQPAAKRDRHGRRQWDPDRAGEHHRHRQRPDCVTIPTYGENTDMRGTVMTSGKSPMKTATGFPMQHSAAAAAPSGLRFYPGYLDRAQQQALLAALLRILEAAPLFTPRRPRSGRPFSVRMSNCGPLGWVSDERGYRYQPTHPVT